MTIRQQGGVFGRNPTFNNVTVDGTLTVDQIVEKTGAAGITLDGVTLKDGNVVLANGKGIDFSATSGTGTSELFDDYEEGNWTPTTAGDATGAFSGQWGSYIKIGRMVFVQFQFAVSSNFTSTGVGGLPYTPSGGGLSGNVSVFSASAATTQDYTIANLTTFFFLTAPNTTAGTYRGMATYMTA